MTADEKTPARISHRLFTTSYLEMRIEMIKLVASDLDGTIVSENNYINKSNFEAIDMMNNRNIDFAICTGKSYSVSQDLCRKCHATYGIFNNGSQIYNLKTGVPIFKNFFLLMR